MSRYPTATKTVQSFIARINAHDIDGLVALMAEEHRFVDSLGAVFEGRQTLRGGWTAYLRMVPDYAIEVERLVAEGSDVIVLGWARGTYTRDGVLHASDAWRTPGAWLARVKKGEIVEWRVYADNEPIRKRLREAAV